MGKFETSSLYGRGTTAQPIKIIHFVFYNDASRPLIRSKPRLSQYVIMELFRIFLREISRTCINHSTSSFCDIRTM